MTGEIVKDYLERYPNTMTLTLAKLIYKENPELFTNVETVRSRIRYYRGAMGSSGRKRLNTDKYIREDGDKARGWALNAEQIDYASFVIPTAYKSILVLSDLHIPYHDEKALQAAIRYGRGKDIDCIILNGDIVDFFQLSRFVKDPRQRSFSHELECLYEFFCIISAEFPKAKIYYKQGNHEYRLEVYLRVKAPELLGVEEFELPILANFTEFGIEWVDKKRVITLDKLNILHGHEYPGMSSSVNPARGMFLKAKKNVVCGHFHQTSEHSEPDISGKPIACWSMGCLCQLHPEYMPLNKWNHGFVHVRRLDHGFSLDNIRIYNGGVL